VFGLSGIPGNVPGRGCIVKKGAVLAGEIAAVIACRGNGHFFYELFEIAIGIESSMSGLVPVGSINDKGRPVFCAVGIAAGTIF
jgi:hypothetical protein